MTTYGSLSPFETPKRFVSTKGSFFTNQRPTRGCLLILTFASHFFWIKIRGIRHQSHLINNVRCGPSRLVHQLSSPHKYGKNVFDC